MPGPVRLAYPPRPPPRRRGLNRDEFYARPTEPLSRWDDGFLAGRDLLAGGTWMGIADSRRFAAVTNVRNRPLHGARRARPARRLPPRRAVTRRLRRTGGRDDAEYGSFNLLVGDPTELWWATNRPHGRRQPVEPGVHGLSNAELDTPWPKVTGGKQAFAAALAADDGSPEADPGAYFDVLADSDPAPWDSLPDTGIEPELEARPVVPVHSLRRLRDAGVDTAAGPAGRHLRHHRTTVRRERPHRRGPLPRT